MSTSQITLSRQVGLIAEMRAIANNIANQSTTGFRREGVIFSEYVVTAPRAEASVSMTATRARHVDLTQGALTQTNAPFDFAIQGEGFFRVLSPDGTERLTRAGQFSPDAQGALVTPDGLQLADAGGAPVVVPPGVAKVSVATDGTLSADGVPLAQIGLVRPNDPNDLTRSSGALFSTQGGTVPQEDSVILQGFVEAANVNPIVEIARMIEVQRAYELGQSFLERESERRSEVIRTLTS